VCLLCVGACVSDRGCVCVSTRSRLRGTMCLTFLWGSFARGVKLFLEAVCLPYGRSSRSARRLLPSPSPVRVSLRPPNINERPARALAARCHLHQAAPCRCHRAVDRCMAGVCRSSRRNVVCSPMCRSPCVGNEPAERRPAVGIARAHRRLPLHQRHPDAAGFGGLTTVRQLRRCRTCRASIFSPARAGATTPSS